MFKDPIKNYFKEIIILILIFLIIISKIQAHVPIYLKNGQKF